VQVDTVRFADSMTFSTDSTTLIYDALSELKYGGGPLVQTWSIYSLHLDSGQTTILVPPTDGSIPEIRRSAGLAIGTLFMTLLVRRRERHRLPCLIFSLARHHPSHPLPAVSRIQHFSGMKAELLIRLRT
jgi:hypothetical protein